MSKQRGFTLIELLVVILVIAVLAALAISSYQEQVRKSRRANAVNEVGQVQLQFERWRAENPCYGQSGANGCSTFTASGTYPTTTPTDIFPNDAYYKVALSLVNATSSTTYTLTATPRSGSAQFGDRCGVLCAFPPGGTATATCGTNKPLWANADCN